MAERNKPRVPLVAVVVGGLLAGAGLFGLFRGVNAEPLPEPVPALRPDQPRPDPFGALPVPVIPPPDASPLPPVPPVQPSGGVIPPVTTPIPLPPLPKADAKPEAGALPVPVAPPAAPTAPTPLPPVSPDSLPKPVELPAPKPVDAVPLPSPKLEPIPSPVPAKIDPIPDVKPADPLPKPVDVTPELPKPVESLPVLPKPVETPQPVTPLPVPPANAENGLRPEPAPLTVNPGPTPVGTETLPPPRKVGNETAPPPRPVVEETVAPMPKPDAVVPIAAPFTPGSTPMTASRHTMLTAVLGAALAAAPAFAQDNPKPADADTIKAIQKEITDLKADVKLLKEEKKKLEKDLYGILDSQRKTEVEKGALIRLDEAQKEAEKMAAKIKELETTLAQKSVSEKQPLAAPTVTPGKGVVRLLNEYNVKVSMMVNGTTYQLGVNEVKTIEVPEGKLKYELVEFPNAVTKETSIKEGETVTLRIK